jgi:hypothetical protein
MRDVCMSASTAFTTACVSDACVMHEGCMSASTAFTTACVRVKGLGFRV